jgi:hypothetical protein
VTIFTQFEKEFWGKNRMIFHGKVAQSIFQGKTLLLRRQIRRALWCVRYTGVTLLYRQWKRVKRKAPSKAGQWRLRRLRHVAN